MTQNLDTSGVIKTLDCSFEQFQPTNVNQTNLWELSLQAGEQLAKYYKECGEQLAKYYKESVILYLNSQNPQLSSPNCCSQKRKKLKELIEIEQYTKKHHQT